MAGEIVPDGESENLSPLPISFAHCNMALAFGAPFSTPTPFMANKEICFVTWRKKGGVGEQASKQSY